MATVSVSDYLPMIAQRALIAWQKLPPQHKSWISPEDMVQEGVIFAKLSVLPKFKPHRAKFSTFLYTSLENYFKYRMAAYYFQKRNACRTVPLNEACFVPQRCTKFEWCDTVEAFSTLCAQASPNLRFYLHHWLFSKGHVHCRGPRFSVVCAEFQKLCVRFGLNRDDVAMLLRNGLQERAYQPLQALLTK